MEESAVELSRNASIKGRGKATMMGLWKVVWIKLDYVNYFRIYVKGDFDSIRQEKHSSMLIVLKQAFANCILYVTSGRHYRTRPPIVTLIC